MIELKEELAIIKYSLFTGHEWLPKEPMIMGGSVARALLNCVHFDGFFGMQGGSEEFLKKEFNLSPTLLFTETNEVHKRLKTEVIYVPPLLPLLHSLTCFSFNTVYYALSKNCGRDGRCAGHNVRENGVGGERGD